MNPRSHLINRFSFHFNAAWIAKCGRGWFLEKKTWPDHRLMVIRGGVGRLHGVDRDIELRRGRIVLTLPGNIYGVSQNSRHRLVISVIRFQAYNSHGKAVSISKDFCSPAFAGSHGLLAVEECGCPPKPWRRRTGAASPFAQASGDRSAGLSAVVRRTEVDSAEVPQVPWAPARGAPQSCTQHPDFFLIEQLVLRLIHSIHYFSYKTNSLSTALLEVILWLIRGKEFQYDDPLLGKAITAHDLRPALDLRPKPGQKEPSISFLARLCGMTPLTFRRKFFRVHRQHPKDFFLKRRMAQAKTLLLESPFTVEAIAGELGYSDSTYFSRQFKKRVGMSPQTFRTSNQ